MPTRPSIVNVRSYDIIFPVARWELGGRSRSIFSRFLAWPSPGSGFEAINLEDAFSGSWALYWCPLWPRPFVPTRGFHSPDFLVFVEGAFLARMAYCLL